MADIHIAAQQGYSSEAQSYARGRPEYAEDILPWLEKVLGIVEGKAVVDLGAGTGKFTKLLERTEADVTAVEPVDAMRAEIAKLTTVRWVKGTAQHTTLDDASADAVVCAQAFHWFADAASLKEIHRVLKPGGHLGLVWNVRDESVDWVRALTDIMTPHEGDAPRFYKGDWRKPFDDAAVGGKLFSALERTDFAYTHKGPPQEVVMDRVMSVSFIAALPEAESAKVRAQVQELIDSHPALRGRDEIAFPYRTETYRCVRL